MRPERLYLQDILDAMDEAGLFLQGTDSAGFLMDKMLQSAVLLKLIMIGEAAARLPAALKDTHPQVPWKRMAAFRNFAVHEYFAVDWRVVWDTATLNIPPLRGQIASILASIATS